MDHHTRRRFLLSVSSSVGFIGGCAGIKNESDRSPAEITLTNRGEKRAMTVTVVQSDDGEQMLSEELTLPSGESKYYRDIIRTQGEYTLTIEVQNGPEKSHSWKATPNKLPSLSAIIKEGVINFHTVTA